MGGSRPDDGSPWRPLAVILALALALTLGRLLGERWPDLGWAATLLAVVPIYLTARWSGLQAGLLLTGLTVLFSAFLLEWAAPVVTVGVAGAGLSLLEHRHRQERERLWAELEQIRAEATRDELTGLLNWRSFKYTLQRQLRMFPDQPFALLLLDLDHFKVYNDTCGHLAGDRLLVEVARLISGELPPGSLTFRYGGEEFAIIVPAADAGRGMQVAEGIRRRMEGAVFPGAERLPRGHLSVSIGVASFPLHARYPEQLIELADEALYDAKRSGRNRVVLWDDPEPLPMRRPK